MTNTQHQTRGEPSQKILALAIGQMDGENVTAAPQNLLTKHTYWSTRSCFAVGGTYSVNTKYCFVFYQF